MIFSNPKMIAFFSNLNNLGYVVIFIAGLLFSFGFTTPFAIGILLNSSHQSLIFAGIIGGFGAMLSDLFIYKVIKISFIDEFNKLKKEKEMKIIRKSFDRFSGRFKSYLLYILAGLIIASPMPDEIGVSMLAGLAHIKIETLALISFVFNTVGIMILLSI